MSELALDVGLLELLEGRVLPLGELLEAGQLLVAPGDRALDGAPGEPGTPGKDGAEGPAGPAGRGITGVTYSSATNKWTISYSDGSSEQVDGPAIPTQLSQLTGDASHRTVSDSQITAWNAKADKTYVDGLVGNINTVLDTINGEVV